MFKKFFPPGLIGNKADVNDCGGQYNTPIARAAYNGDIETANMLIFAGAEVYTNTVSAENPLMIAAEKGHVEMVKFLITKNAGINDVDHTGKTPLMIAAEKGHGAIVKILIDKGANTSSLMNNSSTTALSLATKYHHKAVVKLLQAAAEAEAAKKAKAEAEKLAAKASEPIFDWKNKNDLDEGSIIVSNIPEKGSIYIKKGDIMSYFDSNHNKTIYIQITGFTHDAGGPPTAIKYIFYGYRNNKWGWLYDNGKSYLILPAKFGDYNNLEQTHLTTTDEAEKMAKDAATAAAAAAKAKAQEEDEKKEARNNRVYSNNGYMGMGPTQAEAEAEAKKAVVGEVRKPIIFSWKNTKDLDEGIIVSNIPEKGSIYIKKDDIMSYLDSENNKTRYIWITSFDYNVLGSDVGPPTAIRYLVYRFSKSKNNMWLWDDDHHGRNSSHFTTIPEYFKKLNNLEKTKLSKEQAEKETKEAANIQSATGGKKKTRKTKKSRKQTKTRKTKKSRKQTKKRVKKGKGKGKGKKTKGRK